MAERIIYTTFEPGRERIVSETEYLDLKRQGLIDMEKDTKSEPVQGPEQAPATTTQSTGTTSTTAQGGGRTKDKNKDEE